MENTIQSDLIRGHINTIILKALFDGDRYGYDIVREIEQKSSGQYKLKQPTLYSCLKRLEIQGFIRSYWGAKSNGGRRKYFTLTDMGRALFIKNQSEWEYSRTVIDKLISDKEVDLSTIPNRQTTEEDSLDTDIPQSYEEADPAENDDDSVANAEKNSNFVMDNENANASEASEPQVKQISFADTTAIMNELFRQQTDAVTDASYSDKLISEKYISNRTEENISSDSYFKDFLDESPQADEYIRQNTKTPPQMPSESPIGSKAEVLSTDGTQEEISPLHTPAFLDYHTATVIPRPESAILEREYRNILGDILNQSFADPEPHTEFSPQETASVPKEESEVAPLSEPSNADEDIEKTDETLESYTNDIDVNRKLNRLTGEVREMGDNVIIRTHNTESSKVYNNTYYYYSNKLMIVHYGILFGIMMLEILFSAVFINLILKAGHSNDKWIYISATILAVVFPTIAFIKNFTAPNRRKRINFNLKNSLIYRSIVMIQCLLIIYCLNIIGGMHITFSNAHLAALLLPALLSTCFPVSALIFNALFKSHRFSAEQ